MKRARNKTRTVLCSSRAITAGSRLRATTFKCTRLQQLAVNYQWPLMSAQQQRGPPHAPPRVRNAVSVLKLRKLMLVGEFFGWRAAEGQAVQEFIAAKAAKWMFFDA